MESESVVSSLKIGTDTNPDFVASRSAVKMAGFAARLNLEKIAFVQLLDHSSWCCIFIDISPCSSHSLWLLPATKASTECDLL